MYGEGCNNCLTMYYNVVLSAQHVLAEIKIFWQWGHIYIVINESVLICKTT